MFPISFIILGMSKNIPNIDLATVEMDGCNQPVLIAANIENDPVIIFFFADMFPKTK